MPSCQVHQVDLSSCSFGHALLLEIVGVEDTDSSISGRFSTSYIILLRVMSCKGGTNNNDHLMKLANEAWPTADTFRIIGLLRFTPPIYDHRAR